VLLPLLAARAGGADTFVPPAPTDDFGPMGPLRGEYGFLTQFSGISAEEAKNRVRLMQSNFGIMEYQFYNAFAGYSTPPSSDDMHWYTACFNQKVERRILKAYIEEIKFWGGRAWLTVQAMGTDPGDRKNQKMFKVRGQYMVEKKPLVDVIAPNKQWGKYWAPRWIKFAQDVGFSGIHWNTLGNFDGELGQHSDVPGFLRATKPLMEEAKLGQTFNFVDGFQWDQSLMDEKLIAFTFWPAWSRPKEDAFVKNVPPGSVFLLFPGKDKDHKGEWWQKDAKGKHPFELIVNRWSHARCHGSTYLAVGDGNRHITTDYYPDAQEMSDEEVKALIEKVFDNPPCSLDSSPEAALL